MKNDPHASTPLIARNEAGWQRENRRTALTSGAIALAGLITAGAVGPSACASHVSPEVNLCPCAAGFVCCDSGVCAANTNACGSATAALSRSVQGEWNGYIEGLPAGQDDRIRISIAADANGTLSGHVVLSASSNPPAPPTNPDLGWPATYNGEGMVPGFAYPAHNIRWESQRLKLDVERLEAWQDWCALQSPHPTDSQIDSTPYRCGPRPPKTDEYCQLRASSGQFISYDLCNYGSVCACSATTCAATTSENATNESPPNLQLFIDVALRNGQGDGSIDMTALLPASNSGIGLRNIRLQRGTGPTNGMAGAPGGDGSAGTTGQGGATWVCESQGGAPGWGGGPSSTAGAGGGPGAGGAGGAPATGSSGGSTPPCGNPVAFTVGSSFELGPHNHVFMNATTNVTPVMNYAGQVVFPDPTLQLMFDAPATTDTLTLDPFSGVALDPWLGELSLLPGGCPLQSLVGRTVHVKVLWRLLGAIGNVPDHAIYLGTYHDGVPAPYDDAIDVYPTLPSGKGTGVRTLNTLNAVELTHTFTADDDGSGGIFLRVYLRQAGYEIPTTVYVGSIDW